MAKLTHKLHITGDIIVESGLHIGGSEVELDIGGIDSEVIKIKQGKERIPYIPGSSLKGKLRSIIARHFGYTKPEYDKGTVANLFGIAPKGRDQKRVISQLIIRDSYTKGDVFTEDKAENTIDRLTGAANPRHMERVTKGAVFGLDMILDIYENDNESKLLQTLDLGFQILKKDYLGGSGTRGNGKVNISSLSIKKIIFQNDGSINDKEQHSFSFHANK